MKLSLFLAILGLTVPASTKLPQTPVRIPIQVLGNAVYMQVRINGRGPFWFAVDTGSRRSPMAREQAQAMGLDPDAGPGVEQTAHVDLGQGISASIPATFVSFAGLSALPGRTVCGDVGYNVLNNFVVKIDYEHGAITLFDPDKFRYSGPGAVLPFVLAMDYDPQFEGTFTLDDGTSIHSKFTIDTGAGGTVVSAPIVRSNELLTRVTRRMPVPPSKPMVDGVDGQVFEAVQGRIESVTFGKYTLKQPLIALSRDTNTIFASDVLGVNLGGNILRRFTVFIDYRRSQLILEPNGRFHDPFPADGSGLVLTAQGAGFKTVAVHGVVSGSPADESGIKEGDVITAIDGKPADQFALYQIQDLLKGSGTARRVTIQRGDTKKTLVIKLKALA
jgi:hypothetical protein